MLIKLFADNPAPRQLKIITECLNDGGIVIYPTDTVYGIGCSISKPKAIARIAQIKGIKAKEHNFTLLCESMSQLSNYVKPIPNHIFRIMNKALPGPFTFILEANNKVPDAIHRRKKSIGIRIPDNNIPLEIVRNAGNPLLNSSVFREDDYFDYLTDPELIHEHFKDMVDIVVDGGFSDIIPSTIIDCMTGEPELIRQGKGEFNYL